MLLRAVTGTTLSEYLTPRLWQPMGAEADATWVRTPTAPKPDLEISTRPCATTDGSECCWPMTARSAASRSCRRNICSTRPTGTANPTAFQPRKATPYFGYGYQFWLFPGEKRRFALLGVYGQSIFVDPELKLVMVITAAAKNASRRKGAFGPERDAVWRGIVGKYGSW